MPYKDEEVRGGLGRENHQPWRKWVAGTILQWQRGFFNRRSPTCYGGVAFCSWHWHQPTCVRVRASVTFEIFFNNYKYTRIYWMLINLVSLVSNHPRYKYFFQFTIFKFELLLKQN